MNFLLARPEAAFQSCWGWKCRTRILGDGRWWIHQDLQWHVWRLCFSRHLKWLLTNCDWPWTDFASQECCSENWNSFCIAFAPALSLPYLRELCTDWWCALIANTFGACMQGLDLCYSIAGEGCFSFWSFEVTQELFYWLSYVSGPQQRMLMQPCCFLQSSKILSWAAWPTAFRQNLRHQEQKLIVAAVSELRVLDWFNNLQLCESMLLLLLRLELPRSLMLILTEVIFWLVHANPWLGRRRAPQTPPLRCKPSNKCALVCALLKLGLRCLWEGNLSLRLSET